MDKILVKLKKAVALSGRGNSGPAIRDVRSATLTFSSYRWVLAAVLLVALYFLFWASDRYATISTLYVKSAETGASVRPVQLFGGGQGETKDGLLLVEYTQSNDMLRKMDEAVGFSQHFSSDEGDFFSRLAANPTEEERLKFYKKHLVSL